MHPDDFDRVLDVFELLADDPDAGLPLPGSLDRYCPCGECGLDRAKWSPECKRESGVS